MQDRNDEQRRFIWRIGNQKIAHELKSQRTRSEVRPLKALMRKCNQCLKGFEDVCYCAVGSIGIVFGNVVPNLFKIGYGVRMEPKRTHLRPERRFSLFCRSRLKASSPS